MRTTAPEKGFAWAEPLTFLLGFLDNPKEVGAVIPSSRHLARRVADSARLEGARSVVELGPGTGAITREILKRVPESARVLAIETRARFVKHLRRQIRDPRLSIHQGPASSVAEESARLRMEGVSSVISGIPFSTMPPDLARETLQRIHQVIVPGGRLVVYQYRRDIQELADPIFGRADSFSEFRNLLPARVFVWHKS